MNKYIVILLKVMPVSGAVIFTREPSNNVHLTILLESVYRASVKDVL